MLLHTDHARLNLKRDELARLVHACNTRVRCLDGVAWITLDGDRRDILLEAGDSFDIDSDADVIVFALRRPAAVELQAHAGRTPCERPHRASTWRTLSAWLRPAPLGAA